MEILDLKRAYEDVCLADPMDDPETPHWRVDFSDAAIDGYLANVSDAIDRAQSLTRAMDAAEDEEGLASATQSLAKLEKRVIVTFIGTEGYEELLTWMGGGERIEPTEYTSQLGEVFAAFMSMLGRYATNEKLRDCGLLYAEQGKKTKAFLQAARKGKKKGKK